MESVDSVTSAVQAPRKEEGYEVAAETAEKATAADAAHQPAADPLAGLVRAGLDLLNQLASAGTTGQSAKAASALPIERIFDEPSGRSYLKILLPAPDVVERAVGALHALLETLRA